MPQSRTTKVLALSLGTFLTQLVGMVSGIIMARWLSKEDLATYRQTMLAYSFAAPFLTLALPTALYFFLPRRPGEERTVLYSNLVPLGVMGLVFSAFLLFGGGKLLALRFNNPALESTLRLLALYPVFALPAAAIEACLVARGKVGQLTLYNVISRIILTLALIVVCLRTRRPEPLVLTQVVVAGLLLVPALNLMARACPACGASAGPSARLVWEMAKYSVPLGLATMLGTMTLQLASVIVSALCTPAEFAVYSVGAVELPLVGIVTGSITTVVLADMARLCQEGRKDEALRLFQAAAVRSAAILLPAMLFFLVTAEPFIKALYSEKYADSVLPFRLYLLVLPVRIVTYGAALMALGKTRSVLYRSIGDFLLNAALCVLLVRWMGYLGGVLALLVTLYVWSTGYNLCAIGRGFGVRISRLLPVADLARIFLWSLPGVVPAAVCIRLMHPNYLAQLAVGALIYWPITALCMHRAGYLPHLTAAQAAGARLGAWLQGKLPA